jgi:hypothetical protein
MIERLLLPLITARLAGCTSRFNALGRIAPTEGEFREWSLSVCHVLKYLVGYTTTKGTILRKLQAHVKGLSNTRP